MDSGVESQKYRFALDPLGEGIQSRGYELATLMTEESPLGMLPEVWDDRETREQYPDAIDAVGEAEAAFMVGRLSALFGSVTLEEGEIEGVGFLAPLLVYCVDEEEGDPVALAAAFARFDEVIFACVALADDEDERALVARAFWSMVFDDLEDIEEEEARVFNQEDEHWLCYGVVDGELFMREEDPDEEDLAELEDSPYGQDRYDYDDDRAEDEY